MRPSVYIETTIPASTSRGVRSRRMVARRHWTRDWWDNHRSSYEYELLTSDAVADELERGDFPNRNEALALIQDLPLLEVSRAVADTVGAYVAHYVMPADPAGDGCGVRRWRGAEMPLYKGFCEVVPRPRASRPHRAGGPASPENGTSPREAGVPSASVDGRSAAGGTPYCKAGGTPASDRTRRSQGTWIPAFAGMTAPRSRERSGQSRCPRSQDAPVPRKDRK